MPGTGHAEPAYTERAKEIPVNDLIDTTEMYLRTVFELQEERIPPLRARIAERLGQSGPTVSQTVARMARDGLLSVEDDRQILLTATGQDLATRVMRKHRLAECMLVEILDLPWDQVHAEACRWEHVISENVEQRLFSVLGNPVVSPFGNPIPALDELSPKYAPAPSPETGTLSLLDAAHERVRTIRVLRIDETAQAEKATLAACRRLGLHPGGTVDCRTAGDRIQVGKSGESADLPRSLAAHILVVPIGSLDGDESNAG